MTNNNSALMEDFLAYSVVATGFSEFELVGTGQSALYFNTVLEHVGEERLSELFSIFKTDGIETALNDSLYGPIACNITKLWYIATWDVIKNIAKLGDKAFIVSPESYTEGLVWPTIGVNPPAAKPQGFASWATPPIVKVQ